MSSTTEMHVEAFARDMEQRLAENRHKGDRAGWRKEAPAHHWFKAKGHLEAMMASIKREASPDEVRQHAADAANRLMMAADTYAIGESGPE